MPKISFGIIVLNGQPFLPYNLRALYPWAHQIIISEGASPNATHAAREDGHSLDGTLEYLRGFKEKHDPEDKIIIVTAEDEGHSNGFWPGEKDEQSRAYATRATGDWLWQVDVDEFYRDSDIQTVMDMLTQDPAITAMTFPEIPFWGSFDYRCDGPYLRCHYSKFHRLFKWAEGYEYVTHRPPTVIDGEGRDLRTIKWIDSELLSKRGVSLYHYTQIFMSQVKAKMLYYEKLIDSMNVQKRIIENVDNWYETTFANLEDPYHVHTVNTWPSWLVRFEEVHPEAIQKMQADLQAGILNDSMRDMTDVERVLQSVAFSKEIDRLKWRTNFIEHPKRLLRSLLKRESSPLEFVCRMWGIVTGSGRLFPEK